MNRQSDYNMSEKMVAGSVEPFTKEQRQRLEALTFARRLNTHGGQTLAEGPLAISEMIRVADYIVQGRA